jgi:hypothetical protein
MHIQHNNSGVSSHFFNYFEHNNIWAVKLSSMKFLENPSSGFRAVTYAQTDGDTWGTVLKISSQTRQKQLTEIGWTGTCVKICVGTKKYFVLKLWSKIKHTSCSSTLPRNLLSEMIKREQICQNYNSMRTVPNLFRSYVSYRVQSSKHAAKSYNYSCQ